MNREKRLRRVAILCCHFIHNCAYYRAGWNWSKSNVTTPILATIINNFIDISVLEWLKLFGDHNDKHHWKKVTSDSDEFKKVMLKQTCIAENDFINCRQSFKTYRDKFLAHLDSDEKMQIPKLDIALLVAKYYYNYITTELGASGSYNLPRDIEVYYVKCFADSETYFGNL